MKAATTSEALHILENPDKSSELTSIMRKLKSKQDVGDAERIIEIAGKKYRVSTVRKPAK